jgi:hypothetical protein
MGSSCQKVSASADLTYLNNDILAGRGGSLYWPNTSMSNNELMCLRATSAIGSVNTTTYHAATRFCYRRSGLLATIIISNDPTQAHKLKLNINRWHAVP